MSSVQARVLGELCSVHSPQGRVTGCHSCADELGSVQARLLCGCGGAASCGCAVSAQHETCADCIIDMAGQNWDPGAAAAAWLQQVLGANGDRAVRAS